MDTRETNKGQNLELDEIRNSRVINTLNNLSIQN